MAWKPACHTFSVSVVLAPVMASVPLMVWVPVKALFAASCGTLVVSRFSRYRLKQFLATDPGRALVGRALVLSKELGSSISRLQTLDSLSFHLVQISPVTSYLVPALLHRERGARGTHERARCCPRSARYHDGVRAGRRPPVADATGAITSASHLKRNPGEEHAGKQHGRLFCSRSPGKVRLPRLPPPPS